MSITESQTDSVYLSSSISSLHRSKKSSSEISKTYKHASQLYLTRRLVECYEALQPVIQPIAKAEKENGHVSTSEDDSSSRAPIAAASTSQRIKIWSLYATLLNTIVELGDDEGKREFGNKLYREIIRNVQSGEVWEQVVNNGYFGREANVDAEVVYNLSNLLLGQAVDQSINQTRLETYLSASAQASISLSSASFQNGHKHRSSKGMDTPRDLNSRIKLLELFVLHVLPSNNEWDYARSFVANSDILDEERREAFLQTISELQEAKEQEEAEAAAEQDLLGFAEETEDEEPQSIQDRIRMNEDGDEQHINGSMSPEHSPPDTSRRQSSHHRTKSEVDYGIDDDDFVRPQHPTVNPPESTTTTKATSTANSVSNRTLSPSPSVPQPSTTSSIFPTQNPAVSTPQTSQQRKTALPPPARKSNSNNNTSKKPTVRPQSHVAKLLRILGNLTSLISSSLSRNPTQVFRTLMFVFAFLAVLARRDIRERLKVVVSKGWAKVKQTAGVGMKVSYV